MAWDALAKRRSPIQLQPELSKYAEGIDIQSPDLEWAITQHVNILMLNGTKIECRSLDAKPQARSDVDDIRIWFGSQWAKVNENRKLDKANGRSIIKYGVAINRIFGKYPEAKEDEDSEEEEGNEECFRVEHVNVLECAWHPLFEPTILIQKSTVKAVEARDMQSSSGKFLTLDQANKLQFVGEREPLAEWNSFATRVPYFTVTTRAAKDPETGKWTLSEHIAPQDSKDAEVDGQELSSCECPVCPYVVIPGAGEDPDETDPHLRYRPMMYRLYVYVQEYNFWRTVLSAMARKYSGDNVLYMNLSQINAQAIPFLEQQFPVEGSGSTRKLVLDLPEPGSGQMAVSPSKIERMPAEIEVHALEMFNENKRLIADAMPNRFMTGEAFGEVRDGTGAAVINMTEAARIPYSAELTMLDGGSKSTLMRFVDHILYWDGESPSAAQRRYYAVATGSEPLARGDIPPGTRVYVTADKLRRAFQLDVVTRNLTQAEESQEALMAYQDKAQGVITFEQLLERRGHDDPTKQMEELEKDRVRQMQRPHTDQLILQSLSVLFAALSGVNVAALMGLNLPQPPPSQQPSGTPAELQPNRTQGGAPVWRPGSQAESLPPMQSGQPTGMMARSAPPGPAFGRPSITPSPVEGPTGGSSPMGYGR